MSIIMRNKPHMFTIFSRDNDHFMTAVAGGIARYDLTIKLSQADVSYLAADENKAIALARDLITRTGAYTENWFARQLILL